MNGIIEIINGEDIKVAFGVTKEYFNNEILNSRQLSKSSINQYGVELQQHDVCLKLYFMMASDMSIEVAFKDMPELEEQMQNDFDNIAVGNMIDYKERLRRGLKMDKRK